MVAGNLMAVYKIIFFGIILLYECSAQINLTGINTSNTSYLPSLDIIFSRSLVVDESNFLTSFIDVSVLQCKTKCFVRIDCVAIQYRVLHKYCSLLSNYSTTQNARGFAVVSRFNATSRSCGNSPCNSTQVCDRSTNQCVITECGYPGFAHNITGNIFGVWARAMYNTSGNIQQIECGSDGQWTGILYNGFTCEDIRLSRPNMTSGFYRNSLNMTIVCDFDTDGGGWLIFQKRFDGSVNFYRDWTNYKYGFGEPYGEFWFGLENLYEILNRTDKEFDLRIDMEDWGGVSKHAVYENFSISDATDFYRLYVGSYSGTAGDALRNSMEPHNGQRFSTYDEDQDSYDYSCAERFSGAWWYYNCHLANLNGRYYPQGVIGNYASGMLWFPWTGMYQYVKNSSMKIRERSD